MNKHLQLVREFLEAFAFPYAIYGATVTLNDMEIISRQALLMKEGSHVLIAMKDGEVLEILLGLVELSYHALGSIAILGQDVVEAKIDWQHDGSVLAVMRAIVDKINACSTGTTENYSALYSLCVIISTRFINADFDRAFEEIHNHDMTRANEGSNTIYRNSDKLPLSKPYDEPDLSNCLFE